MDRKERHLCLHVILPWRQVHLYFMLVPLLPLPMTVLFLPHKSNKVRVKFSGKVSIPQYYVHTICIVYSKLNNTILVYLTARCCDVNIFGVFGDALESRQQAYLG